MIRRSLVLLAACSASLASLISQSALAAAWIGPYEVTYIEASSAGVYFMLNEYGTLTYDTGIANCYNHAIMFPASSPKEADRAFATGIAARASGHKVKFYVSGCNVYAVATAIASDPRW